MVIQTNDENLQLIEERNNNERSNSSCIDKYLPFLTLGFYRKYFDFPDEEVIERLRLSVFFQKEELINRIKRKPDLFNPVWINISLIVTLAILSNINAFLNYDGKDFPFDYNVFTEAVSLVFGFFITIPSIFFLFLLTLGFKLEKERIIQCFTLYAYSNFYLLIAVLLCFIPNDFIDFIALCGGGALSIMFLLVVFAEYLSQFKGNIYYLGLIILAGGQLLVCFTYKTTFFSNINYNR